MKIISKKLAVVCLTLPLIGLAGCETMGSGGSDGAMMDDLLSERAVYSAIFKESSLSDDGIQVSCVGGVITLTGQVDDEVERQLAERLAADVAGVTNVKNGLTTES